LDNLDGAADRRTASRAAKKISSVMPPLTLPLKT
jgi:hypothetical protein